MDTASRPLCAMLIVALLGAPVIADAQDRWFARDKAAHFGATTTIAAASYGVAASVTERQRWRIVIGASNGIGAAAAKELWDRSHGDASWRDLAWGAIGTATGVIIARAIDRAQRPRRPVQSSGP